MASEPEAGGSSSLADSLSDTERSAARYLFAISVLSEHDTDRITTGELQGYLNVAPASVTEMVSKLDDRGLVEYEKYQGVTLTDRGDALATEVGWRFCVVSTFFGSELNTTIDDQTAFDIGFVLPQDGIVRLRELVSVPCLHLCPESGRNSNRCVA